MTLKDQWKTVKENWLIAVIVLVILFVPLFSGTSLMGVSKSLAAPMALMYESEDMAYATNFRGGGVYYDNDFAPDVDERKITKTASLSSEVKHGDFADAETKLKAIVIATDSYLLSENVNKYDSGWKSYYNGYYQLKVDTSKYDVIISQLKEIGEVESFNENARDITGSYTNLEDQLEAEQARLTRYKQMYNEAEDISDKIELNDRIFNQERTIKYLQDALENKDRQIDYSTVTVSLREKQSEYTNIVLVKFSQLIRSLVNSFNNLLSLIFWAVPWAIALAVIWVAVRFYKKKKN